MNAIITFTILLLSIFCMTCQKSQPTYASLEDYPIYSKNDLGLSYHPFVSSFKLWSPEAQAVRLRLYIKDLEGEAFQEEAMKRGNKGLWVAKIKGDLKYSYYTYQVKYKGEWLAESPDPYSIACGTNGQRSQIIDLKNTNPINWEKEKRPPLASPNDIVLYELHIRDFSIADNSDIRHKGQYLAFLEQNTKSPSGVATGINHLQEMGITHVHLLPSYNFNSVDESLPKEQRSYNWGYDPHLYNVPEGSYATYAQEGEVRIREFKSMILALHQAGIRVVLDMVYNHTGATETSVFNQTTPHYYYRQNAEGGFSNASACGNETASERPMVRQFILQSIRYWIEEYHVDGFRFDLMGIHDIETMNAISKLAHSIDPSIFLYGEGWAGGDSPLPEAQRAVKANVPQLKHIAAFSDEIRDAIKGGVFTPDARGFISGMEGLEESIKFGVVGATKHPQVHFENVNYTNTPWSPQPSQCIVYASCHDNHTLWDRLQLSIPEASEADHIKMQELALGIVLTAQGIPFLHAGSEFCRSKQGDENSYKSPDAINQLDWERKATFLPTTQFVQQLIALRKKHPAFRMQRTEQIAQHLHFLSTDTPNFLAFTLNGKAVGDTWDDILVLYNANNRVVEMELPKANWKVVVQGNQVNEKGLKTIKGTSLGMNGLEMLILVR